MEPVTPTYHQIKMSIKNQIAEGFLKPGDLLPGRVALSEQYGCSWSTLNRAINELILEGVLTAQKGRGTYVSAAARPNALDSPIPVWFCNPFPSVYMTLSEMMDGLRTVASERNRSIQFIENADTPDNIHGYIVITPSYEQVPFLTRAWESGQRFVVLNSHFDDVPFSCINSDLYQGSKTVFRYLIHQGHTKIGMLGLREGFPNYELRKAAFRECFEEQKLPYTEEWFVGRPEDVKDAKDVFGDWIDRHPECTAIVSADYMSTVSLLEALAEKDVDIPQHLSIFSSGHLPFESYMKVSLSTMVQPFHRLGQTAMRRLLDGQFDRGVELLPCDILFKDSVRPIR